MIGQQFITESKIAQISQEYAKKKKISTDNAMRKFLNSTTYEILTDPETGLYLEMFEYVYEMFLKEKGELLDEEA